MPAEAKTENDHQASVISRGHDWRVASVEALPGWRLHVRFNDDLDGFVDMEREVHAPDAGVFVGLADLERFAAAQVVFEVVT